MNIFEATTSTGKVVTGFIGSFLLGGFLGLAAYFILERVSSLSVVEIVPIAGGVAAVSAVGLALSALFGTVKRVELDERVLRFHMLTGSTREYPRGTHGFQPRITHRTSRGQHVGTDRAVVVHGPQGEKVYTLAIEPEEFSELINRLSGQPVGVAPGHGGAPFQSGPPAWPGARRAVQQSEPPVAAFRALDFPPQQFELTRRPIRRLSITFLVIAGVMALVGIVCLIGATASGEPESGVVLFVVFLLVGLLFTVSPLMLRRRAKDIPGRIVVAPTWVSFDDRVFEYRDLRVIQIKPPGEVFKRSAKIMTHAGERIIIPLGIDNHPKIFPDYDAFATVLNAAGSAAAGVVRIDFS